MTESDAYPQTRPIGVTWLWLAFAFWAFWLVTPAAFRGPLSYVKIHANADGHLSHLIWMREVARDFSPVLDPSMGGIDRLADFGVPTIVHLFGVVLPIPAAYVLLLYLQVMVAVVGTYLLCRNVLRVSVPVAVLAGMAFSVGATRGESIGVNWIYLHILHEPGFPLLLYAAFRLPLERLRCALWLSALAGIALSLTSVMEIGFIFTFPCAFIFGLIVRDDLRSASRIATYTFAFVVCGLVVLILQGPHFWAALVASADSARGILQIEKRSFAWSLGRITRRAGEMIPHLLLAAWWLLRFRVHSRADWAVAVMLLLTFIGGPYARPAGQMVWDLVPFLSGFFFDRLFLYGPFFLICAAAFGLDRIQLPSIRVLVVGRRRHLEAGASILPVLAGAALVFHASLQNFATATAASRAVPNAGENWHRLFANPDLRALARETRGVPVRTVTVDARDAVASWQPAFNLAYGLETADGFKMIYPWRYHQFWRQVVDNAYRATEPNLTRSFMDISGSRMFLFPYADPADASRGPTYNLDLLSLANVGFVISRTPLADERLILRPPAYTDAMRAEWARSSLIAKLRGVASGRDYLGERLYVYDNPLALPRYFVAPRLRTFQDADALLATLGTASVSDFTGAVFCAEADVPPSLRSDGLAGGTVDVVSYSLERSVLRVRSDGGYLVCSTPFARFWTCTIGGRRAEILPAYHAFMMVPVPAGELEVEWRYEPPYAAWNRWMYGLLKPWGRGG